jgi:hypothetical protein
MELVKEGEELLKYLVCSGSHCPTCGHIGLLEEQNKGAYWVEILEHETHLAEILEHETFTSSSRQEIEPGKDHIGRFYAKIT